MTIPIPDPGRIARRRRAHERQVVIFTVLAAFLFAALLFAVTVFTGAIHPAFLNRDFTGAPAAEQTFDAPCLPTNPGLPFGQPPLPHSDIHVRVLNASGLQGIAGAFEQVLGQRGFIVDETGAYPEELAHNQLRFGRDGIVAAYTLAGQFEDIDLVLDDRPGPVVDLITGRSYAKPIPLEDVTLEQGTPMDSRPGCVDAGALTPQPGPTDLVWPPPAPKPEEPEEGEDTEATE